MKYSGNDVARKLLEFEHGAAASPQFVRLGNCRNDSGRYLIERGTLTVACFWYALPDPASFVPDKMLTMPVRVTLTEVPYRMSFFGVSPDGHRVKFVWFREDRGLPIHEIPISTLEVESELSFSELLFGRE